MTNIEVVLDAKATIGESPTWSPDEAALYWIDVKAPALYRFDPATGHQRTWRVPADIGAFALEPGLAGALVALVALRTGLHWLAFATGELTLVAPPPFDLAMHRFNEGGYWCALHGGDRLRRFHADGRADRDIALPVSQPTHGAQSLLQLVGFIGVYVSGSQGCPALFGLSGDHRSLNKTSDCGDGD